MNRILKLKNSLLTNLALNGQNIPIDKILHDTRFLLYCFRHYKYVDNNFNLKVSDLIIKNLSQYQTSIEKSQAINLFVQINLVNGLKVSPSQSQTLLANLESIENIPNLKWLINIAVVLMNSDIYNPKLWKIIEQHYMHNNFTTTNPITAEELLKLAFVMSSMQNNSSIMWQKLLNNLDTVRDELNSSQKVMLAKSLAKLDYKSIFIEESIIEKYKSYLLYLITSSLKAKDLLTVKELVGLLLAAHQARLLSESILAEIEEVLFDKPSMISMKNIYDLNKLYTKFSLTKERKEFLKELRKTFLTKFDKSITFKDAFNFHLINNHLHNTGIISTQDYNEPYYHFILDGKFEVFEHLYVARMNTSSIVEVLNFSLLVQGQLSKYVLHIPPEILLKVFLFFELRGEISKTFLDLVFSINKKYMNPVQESHSKQQLYAYLLYIKFDTSVIKGQNLTTMCKRLKEKLQDLDSSEMNEEILTFFMEHESEIAEEYLKAVKKFYKPTINKLSEDAVYNLFSLLNENDLKQKSFKEELEDYLMLNFKYMNTEALCKSYHLINSVLPKEHIRLTIQTIKSKILTIVEIEQLTRKLELLSDELKLHIEESFKVTKKTINWKNIGSTEKIILRLLKQSSEREFIQELYETISTHQRYFNQRTLDKLIQAYSKAIEGGE